MLGIPKGSLQESTLRLFQQSGWRISLSDRNYFPEINDPCISCSICRAQEMSRYVESGTFDVGLTGLDWIMENDSKIHVVTDLVYSKVSQRPARWVLAVPMDSPDTSGRGPGGKKIATELVNFTKRYFESKGIKVDVEFSWGATEAKVISGLCDAIVEVTETGSTMRANGLRIVNELMQSNTQLIANPRMGRPLETRKNRAHCTPSQRCAPGRRPCRTQDECAKGKIEHIEILPSLNAPTIAHLYQSDWLSVETVVSKNHVRELIPNLIKRGAEGIIEYSLNKVI